MLANILPKATVDSTAEFAPKLLKLTALVKSWPAGPWIPWVALNVTHAEPLFPWKTGGETVLFNLTSPLKPILE